MSVPAGDWFCRLCDYQRTCGASYRRPACAVCFQSENGAWMRTVTNTWVHMACAIYVRDEYVLFVTLFIALLFLPVAHRL